MSKKIEKLFGVLKLYQSIDIQLNAEQNALIQKVNNNKEAITNLDKMFFLEQSKFTDNFAMSYILDEYRKYIQEKKKLHLAKIDSLQNMIDKINVLLIENYKKHKVLEVFLQKKSMEYRKKFDKKEEILLQDQNRITNFFSSVD